MVFVSPVDVVVVFVLTYPHILVVFPEHGLNGVFPAFVPQYIFTSYCPFDVHCAFAVAQNAAVSTTMANVFFMFVLFYSIFPRAGMGTRLFFSEFHVDYMKYP